MTMSPKPQNNGAAPALAGVLSLLASSACCLPWGAFALAAGTAGASALLAQARPYLVALSLGLIGWGFWRAYGRRACQANRSWGTVAVLWLSLAATLAFLVFPRQVVDIVSGRGLDSATAPTLSAAGLDALRKEFNAARESTRLVVLLSPT